MSEVRLDWIRGKTFVGTDSTRHAIVLSSSDEENGTGVKPSDLLLLALAGCASVDVVDILRKKRQPLEALEVRTEGIQDAEPPWTFRKVHLRFLLRGDLQPAAVEQAIRLSEQKYCSVAATIRATAEVTTSYEITPPPREAAV